MDVAETSREDLCSISPLLSVFHSRLLSRGRIQQPELHRFLRLACVRARPSLAAYAFQQRAGRLILRVLRHQLARKCLLEDALA
jgi:hypothetical protein